MERLHTYSSFKKVNEGSLSNIIDKDKWNINFENIETNVITSFIKNLLDKYKISYKVKDIYDNFEERYVKKYFQFNYKNRNVRIEIDFNGNLVFIHNYHKHIKDFKQNMVRNFNQLIEEILKLSQSDLDKMFKKMNEELTEEKIDENPNTTPEEKEELRIKFHKDKYNEYKSKKNMLENFFGDLETEIDVTTINKLTENNPFMKEYVKLLQKQRQYLSTEKAIEDLEQRIDDIKDDINELKDYEDLSLEDQESADDKIREKRSEISDLESEISDLKSNLNDNNISDMLNKWDNQMRKTIKDLEDGKPLLISNLSWFR